MTQGTLTGKWATKEETMTTENEARDQRIADAMEEARVYFAGAACGTWQNIQASATASIAASLIASNEMKERERADARGDYEDEENPGVFSLVVVETNRGKEEPVAIEEVPGYVRDGNCLSITIQGVRYALDPLDEEV